MRTAVRIVIALGVAGGLAFLIMRFGPEMKSRCHAMLEERFGPSVETVPEQSEDRSEELVEAQG